MITFDHIENLTFPVDQFHNEFQAFRTLGSGALHVARQVWEIEQREKLRRGTAVITFAGTDLPPQIADLIPNLFAWFCINTCNLARTVGFIRAVGVGIVDRETLGEAQSQATLRKAINEYLDGIPEIEPVKVWRNKVAAHPAFTAPESKGTNKDSYSFLELTSIYPVNWMSDRFTVGGTFIRRSFVDGTIEDAKLPQWSVTEITESLRRRYWPNFAFQQAGQPLMS